MSMTAMRGERISPAARAAGRGAAGVGAGAAGLAAGSCAVAVTAVKAPAARAAANVLDICCSLESSANGELERRPLLEGVPVRVEGVDQAEGHVQHRHDEAHLRAGGRAELLEVDPLALQVRLAGVEEEHGTQGAPDVEVVLRVEEDELVPAQGASRPLTLRVRLDGAHAADVHAPDLGLAAQEEALVEGH